MHPRKDALELESIVKQCGLGPKVCMHARLINIDSSDHQMDFPFGSSEKTVFCAVISRTSSSDWYGGFPVGHFDSPHCTSLSFLRLSAQVPAGQCTLSPQKPTRHHSCLCSQYSKSTNLILPSAQWAAKVRRVGAKGKVSLVVGRRRILANLTTLSQGTQVAPVDPAKDLVGGKAKLSRARRADPLRPG